MKFGDHCRTNWVWPGPAAGCTLYWARSAGQAPLAQSVERFHGKEKVNGSIPLGGSVGAVPPAALAGLAV